MKIFGFIAIAIAVSGAASQCTFDPQAACDHCPFDRSWMQFTVNTCNCTQFYMCEKNSDGVIIPHQMECDSCHCFSCDNWSCSIRIADDPVRCPPPPPQKIIPIPTSTAYKDFFCVTFDHDSREKSYYNVDDACIIAAVGDNPSSGYQTHNNGLFSLGYPCDVQIPYFQNNQFKQFTLCGMFVWFPWSNDDMGLVFNGHPSDCWPASISMTLTTNAQVQAQVVTTNGLFGITNTWTVSAGYWHKVCLRYDGGAKKLSLTVDGYTVSRAAKGMTTLQHCDMRLGTGFRQTGPTTYDDLPFFGLMDTWCFSPSIVDESYFLDNNPVGSVVG